MVEEITGADCRVLERYRNSTTGAWTTMREEDKTVYRKIHQRLREIAGAVLRSEGRQQSYDACETLGFSPTGGVRGNRPKDLWCAVFPRDATAYMPQVYMIVSDRGVELGFAPAIHGSDFSNQGFRQRLRELAPHIFDALPEPGSSLSQQIEARLRDHSWFFHRKARLKPKENDFEGFPRQLAKHH